MIAAQGDQESILVMVRSLVNFSPNVIATHFTESRTCPCAGPNQYRNTNNTSYYL